MQIKLLKSMKSQKLESKDQKYAIWVRKEENCQSGKPNSNTRSFRGKKIWEEVIQGNISRKFLKNNKNLQVERAHHAFMTMNDKRPTLGISQWNFRTSRDKGKNLKASGERRESHTKDLESEYHWTQKQIWKTPEHHVFTFMMKNDVYLRIHYLGILTVNCEVE